MPVVAAMTITSHASDAMVAIPFWLEMFAVVAASISGVLVAREHKLDLVGAVALAVVCGLGGGLLRDMTLQVGNVYILNQPMALPLSIATAAIIYIFPAIVDKPEKLIPLLDIISVGIYAATGADKALVYGFAPAVCIMMGFFTAVGGGMLRDGFMGVVPGIVQVEGLAGPVQVTIDAGRIGVIVGRKYVACGVRAGERRRGKHGDRQRDERECHKQAATHLV